MKGQARTIRTGATRVRLALAALAAVGVTAVSMGAANAETTLKVYRSHMPDGSVILGDRPATGARSVESSNYTIAAPRQGSGAEVEREYWRRQAEAFDQRQARRDAMGSRGGGHYRSIAFDGVDGGDGLISPAWYPAGHAARPLVPHHRVSPVYRSSPGAAKGRSFGFIGSGFSTAR